MGWWGGSSSSSSGAAAGAAASATQTRTRTRRRTPPPGAGAGGAGRETTRSAMAEGPKELLSPSRGAAGAAAGRATEAAVLQAFVGEAPPAGASPAAGTVLAEASKWFSPEEAQSMCTMAEAALKAKQRAVEDMVRNNQNIKQELTQERARRRAAEVADEDSGFLRQQMEALLKEKAQLAQENASLLQENRSLSSEVLLLTQQLDNFKSPLREFAKAKPSPGRVKSPEEIEDAHTMWTALSNANDENERLNELILDLKDRHEGRANAWKAQEAALLRCLSEQSREPHSEDFFFMKNSDESITFSSPAPKTWPAKVGASGGGRRALGRAPDGNTPAKGKPGVIMKTPSPWTKGTATRFSNKENTL